MDRGKESGNRPTGAHSVNPNLGNPNLGYVKTSNLLVKLNRKKIREPKTKGMSSAKLIFRVKYPGNDRYPDGNRNSDCICNLSHSENRKGH